MYLAAMLLLQLPMSGGAVRVALCFTLLTLILTSKQVRAAHRNLLQFLVLLRLPLSCAVLYCTGPLLTS
jgi:putative effector of murein hydrolase LrgA (UPF0299 family)